MFGFLPRCRRWQSSGLHSQRERALRPLFCLAHRAGWDATFSAPKSVSLTALVGGDDRVRQAHRESVKVALGEMEKYVQARIGGNHPAETTGKWVAVSFEHDSARPVNGYGSVIEALLSGRDATSIHSTESAQMVDAS